MAGRPLKKGVDYWRFDVDLFDDKRVKLIRGEFGAKGMMILLFALNSCYKENGYFKAFEDDDALLISEELGCGCSLRLVQQVIRACVARSLFDKRVFYTHRVLTSVDIQRRYVQIVAKNRYNILLCAEYWLIPESEIPADALAKCIFFHIDRAENPDLPKEKSDFPYGKFANTIQNNKSPSIARESAEEERGEVQAYGCFGNVRLTPEEYEKLQKEIPNAGDFIDLFSARCASKGYSYENDYAALLSWYLEEKTKQGAPLPAKNSSRKQEKQPEASPPSYGDIDEFFAAALQRTYGKGGVT